MSRRYDHELLTVDNGEEAALAPGMVLAERVLAEVGKNGFITEVDPRTPAFDETLDTRFWALDNPVRGPRQFSADDDDLAAGVMHVAFRGRLSSRMRATARLHFFGDSMYISRFGVLPAAQGRRIGRLMLHTCEQQAISRREIDKVYLMARPTDQSFGFWHNNGYIETGESMVGVLGTYPQMTKRLTR